MRHFCKAFVLPIAIAVLSCSLYGCNDKGDSSETTSSSNSTAQTTQASKTDPKASAKFADYLQAQSIAPLATAFQNIQKGTLIGNAEGLVGATAYDFDKDSNQELVTFSFAKNDAGEDDICIELMTLQKSGCESADRAYLTDLLDISTLDQCNSHSIAQSNRASMQLVSSEYGGTLYFGALLAMEEQAKDDTYPMPAYVKSYCVFTVSGRKIVPCSTVSGEMAVTEYDAAMDIMKDGVYYARVLPPSLRDTLKTENIQADEAGLKRLYSGETYEDSLKCAQEVCNAVNGLITANSKYNLYTSVQERNGTNCCVKGGAFQSPMSVHSAMLNEFGLDVEYGTASANSTAVCSAQFVSRNQSSVQVLLQKNLFKSMQATYSIDYPNYAGYELIADTDLETMLGADKLYTAPFADEIALYQDILRRPYCYRDIWSEEHLSTPVTEYCISDFNQDGKNELVVNFGYPQSNDYNTGVILVVNPEAKACSMEYDIGNSSLEFYNTGIVTDYFMNSLFSAYYLDMQSGEQWEGGNDGGESHYRLLWNRNEESISFEGEAADAKEAEFIAGEKLVPQYTSYDPYRATLQTEVVVTPVEDILYTWKKAYLDQVKDYNSITSNSIDPLGGFQDGFQYALIYLDDDTTPELYVQRNGGGGNLFSFDGGQIVPDYSFNGEWKLNYYVEKTGHLRGEGFNVGGFHYFYQTLSKGEFIDGLKAFASGLPDDDTGTINDKEVTYEEYEKQVNALDESSKGKEPDLKSYDEILTIINH